MKLLEEFGDSQIDISLQLQSIDEEGRKAEEEIRAETILLLDNDSREHAIEKPP